VTTKTTYYSSGGGSMFTLFLVFLVLKLTETINWSWWIVTLPLWVGIVIVFCILLITVFIIGIGAVFIFLRSLFNR